MGGRVPRWTQQPRVPPGEGWAPSGCTLPVTHHAMTSNQPYHTGSVAARVNKDRAFRRTLGRRCQVCYWSIIKDSWKRHHHRHNEHKETKSCKEWSGTDWKSLNSVKWDGRTLAKQQQMKDTRFSSVEKKINTSMELDFLFTKTS